MYSNESLRKYREQLEKAIAFYAKFPVESLSVCISSGNMKIGRVLNVSLPPLVTCGKNCAVCMHKCYDIKACLQYENVMNARSRNYVILRENARIYWEQIRAKMARRRKNKFFRFHVAGDIISTEYLSEMIKTARMFPDFRIWTYTKQYDIVNAYVSNHGNSKRKAIPENLTIMFSQWEGLTMVNPFGFPVFTCVMLGQKPPKGYYKCPGNCDICKAKKRGCPYGESCWVREH
jgi:hypothetical protein